MWYVKSDSAQRLQGLMQGLALESQLSASGEAGAESAYCKRKDYITQADREEDANYFN